MAEAALRIGKWGTGASEEDKKTLFRAVSNIAGDMAAVIPDTMQDRVCRGCNVGAAPYTLQGAV